MWQHRGRVITEEDYERLSVASGLEEEPEMAVIAAESDPLNTEVMAEYSEDETETINAQGVKQIIRRRRRLEAETGILPKPIIQTCVHYQGPCCSHNPSPIQIRVCPKCAVVSTEDNVPPTVVTNKTVNLTVQKAVSVHAPASPSIIPRDGGDSSSSSETPRSIDCLRALEREDQSSMEQSSVASFLLPSRSPVVLPLTKASPRINTATEESRSKESGAPFPFQTKSIPTVRWKPFEVAVLVLDATFPQSSTNKLFVRLRTNNHEGHTGMASSPGDKFVFEAVLSFPLNINSEGLLLDPKEKLTLDFMDCEQRYARRSGVSQLTLAVPVRRLAQTPTCYSGLLHKLAVCHPHTGVQLGTVKVILKRACRSMRCINFKHP
eukprot:Protomagalhaensia_sp_Gyna_25__5035@NODE_560_length_3123_cov_174_700065_g435_i0_p2_GENE_NODE_560_length_3123_cov_174_700065_g435_i0NODE_560_length_3123_cov_174_700065_g435_i0_p2_ORF_typecomplete_len379_score55_14_NODE_560_length_3123_cov_174_700065_g435_i015502686